MGLLPERDAALIGDVSLLIFILPCPLLPVNLSYRLTDLRAVRGDLRTLHDDR